MEEGILISTPDLRPSLMSILKGLDDASLLKKVVTTVAVDPGTVFGKFIMDIHNAIPLNLRRGVDRRVVPDFLRGKTKAVAARELIRLLARKLGSDVLTHQAWLWSEIGFDTTVARKYSGLFECVYGMEHSSLATFTRQKRLGGLCILRQVMAHERLVSDTIKREINKFPEYVTPYLNLLRKDMERAGVRKEAEYGLANLIIANSRFVKDSFIQAGINSEKVVVIPTGCPDYPGISANSGRGSKPLVFLFVGTLSLRKGLPYLIETWRLLKARANAQLWLAGHHELPERLLKKEDNGVRYLGLVSRSNLARIYERADALVLPTLLEGCAHAVLEALSCGMPIITTQESGCSDFVQNERNGFLIKSADTESLYKAMEWCLGHREQLERMGRASLEQARLWTIADSNKAHLFAIQEFLKNKN